MTNVVNMVLISSIDDRAVAVVSNRTRSFSALFSPDMNFYVGCVPNRWTAGDRNARITEALGHMLPPMSHGLVTSILAFLFLVTSELIVIRRYYFGM